jgi:hypothetical protein
MMTKKRQLTKPSENALKIYAKDEAEAQRQVAQTLTSPSVKCGARHLCVCVQNCRG